MIVSIQIFENLSHSVDFPQAHKTLFFLLFSFLSNFSGFNKIRKKIMNEFTQNDSQMNRENIVELKYE